MFPNNSELQKEYPLQSKVFGHRFKQSQSIYEYLLEFLIVTFSKKKVGESGKYTEELFPCITDNKQAIHYIPTNKVGLKRFIFFDKSKQESRFELDKVAYNSHINLLKDRIEIDSNDSFITVDSTINLIQNLLYGFSAVLENRSWFAQSLLPICASTLTSEIMGTKSKRNKSYANEEEFKNHVDNEFETNRYNFMCRGGEIYYLHLLSGINHYPKYKVSIESGFKNIINQFSELEKLCSEIQNTWIEGEELLEYNKSINKTLGTIPNGFTEREEKTLLELANLLHSDMHPFEKMEILSHGIIFQIIVMCYVQARLASNKKSGYLIFDVNCYKGTSDDEIKKLANLSYMSYEQDISDALYNNIDGNLNKNRNKTLKSEKETIDDALNDSSKVFKKIGKQIGIIRPLNDKFIRFTLNEKILKYLVLSIVKPNTKMTLDRFMEKLFDHYGIIIGTEQFIKINKEDARFKNLEPTYLEKNKKDFQIMLKECGFLRELSDSTSIVENPYKEA